MDLKVLLCTLSDDVLSCPKPSQSSIEKARIVSGSSMLVAGFCSWFCSSIVDLCLIGEANLGWESFLLFSEHWIQGMGNLQKLVLVDMMFVGPPTNNFKLLNLKDLCFFGCQGEIPLDCFTEDTLLERLRINAEPGSPIDLNFLSNISKSLKHLSIIHCNYRHGESISSLVNLRTLAIHTNPSFNSDHMTLVDPTCSTPLHPHLEELDLSGIPIFGLNMVLQTFEATPTTYASLKSLRLQSAAPVEFITSLLELCKSLG